jgi:hypothetical protein
MPAIRYRCAQLKRLIYPEQQGFSLGFSAHAKQARVKEEIAFPHKEGYLFYLEKALINSLNTYTLTLD